MSTIYSTLGHCLRTVLSTTLNPVMQLVLKPLPFMLTTLRLNGLGRFTLCWIVVYESDLGLLPVNLTRLRQLRTIPPWKAVEPTLTRCGLWLGDRYVTLVNRAGSGPVPRLLYR